MAWALYPLSLGYGYAVTRRFHNAKPYRSTLPVICVGNFTMGGAGKTPVAIKVAGLLKDQGFQVGFLTRGYGGSERGPHLVDIERDTASLVGDEPLLLARHGMTVVSRDRPSGTKLLETLNIDVIVMDDGFQNPSLAKDLSIVVVDGAVGVGNGRVFPLGPLRAPLAFQAKLADIVIVVGAPADGEAHNISEFQGLLLKAKIEPMITAEAFAGPQIAFCGIGRPAKFFETLEAAGITLLDRVAFPDHHVFGSSDAKKLLDAARATGARLITTEKDHVRLAAGTGLMRDLHATAKVFPISIVFDDDGAEQLVRHLRHVIAPQVSAAARIA